MSTPTSPRESFGERQPQRRPSFYDAHLREMLADSGYTLQERIGSGGMGIVYRATDAAGLDVALKVLRPEIAGDERARVRLSREMRALQRVNHPNVSRVLDAEFELDVAFLVTEYIPGPTFQQVIDQWGHLSLEHVRNIALPLGRALLEVHDKGVVHRDLKPSNIMLRNVNGPRVDFDFDPIDPVIIDFGIAQAAEESRMTSTGLMMGTIAYLAPEVISHNTVDAAADWWAWAAMLAHAATGIPPFGKSRLHSVYSQAMWSGPSLEGLPEPCIAWFEGAFAPEPGDRTPPEKLIEALEDPMVWGSGGYDPVGRDASLSPHPSDASPSSHPSHSPHPSRIDVGKRVKPVELSATGAAGWGGAAAVTGASGLAQSDESSAASSVFAGSSTPVSPNDPEAIAPLQPNSYLNPDGEGGEFSTPARAMGGEGTPYGEGDTDEWDVSDEDPTQVMPVLDETPTAKFAPISTPAPPPAPNHGGVMSSWQASDQAQQAPTRAPGAPSPYQQTPHQPLPYGAQGYGMPPQGFMPPPMPYHLREPERRTVLVLLGMVLFTAFGALVPLTALILLVLMTAFARTWQRSWISQEKGSDRGKSSGSITTSVVLLALPRYIGALLEAILQALIPVIVTAGVLLAIDAAVVWFTDFRLHYAIFAGVLVGVTTLSLWWGIGARTTRFGGHRLLHAAAPSGLWTAVIAALLIVLIAAVGFTIASRDGTIDYFPYLGDFRLEDISPWRR